MGYDIQYVPDEYHFNKYKIWWSKNELYNILKNMYPNEINWLIDKVAIQNAYYNKLLNNNSSII